MANKLTMNISTIDQTGKKSQKAVTDINPAASNEQLTDFANSLNGLTNNTYVNSTKVQVTDLSGEGAKFTRPIVVKFNGEVVEGDELEVPLNEPVEFDVYQADANGDTVFVDALALVQLSYVISNPNDDTFQFAATGHPEVYHWEGTITELKNNSTIDIDICANDTYARFDRSILLKEAE